MPRIEAFCDRILAAVDEAQRAGCHREIIGQLIDSGCSVGANTFEADEAMSRADFCKSLAIANKELSETRFWLRLIQRRNWLSGSTADGLAEECRQLKAIYGAILTKTRKSNPNKRP